MLSLNTNIYASESMDSNEYSIIETFSDGSYIKSVLIDDSTDCSSLARKTSTKTGRRVYSYESSSGKLLLVLFHILVHHPNVLNLKFLQLVLQATGNFHRKKHIHLAHQLRQLHRSSSIKKMYIFKQLQELLLLVVINLENYINSKIG